jgi:protein phosphatase
MDSSIDQPNSRLFILAGIPGCGKSTWARTFFEPGVIISSDSIREELFPGEEYDHNRNEEVFGHFHDRISSRLQRPGLAVADATSLTYQARRKLLDIAEYYFAEKHLIFFNNSLQALYRNTQRTGAARVPKEEQDVMLTKFEKSRSDILKETYTSTTIIEAIL